VGSSQISNQLPVTIVGDSIKISFDVDLEEVIDVSSFENKSQIEYEIEVIKRAKRIFLSPFIFCNNLNEVTLNLLSTTLPTTSAFLWQHKTIFGMRITIVDGTSVNKIGFSVNANS
jgi:hypothetical protein